MIRIPILPRRAYSFAQQRNSFSEAAPDGDSNTAATLTLPEPASINPLPRELREHLEQLRLVLPVISNAVTALRRQNADCDADVAYDLTEQACEPLEYEIQRIECLLATHPAGQRQGEARA